MKKPNKGAFVALSIVALVFFVAWAALFTVNVIFQALGGIEIAKLLLCPLDFTTSTLTIVSDIVSYVFAAIALVMLVLSIVLVKRKPGVKAFCIILSILGLVSGFYSCSCYLVADGTVISGLIMAIMNFKKMPISTGILTVVAGGLAVVYAILLILTVINAAVYSKRCIAKKEAQQKEIEEQEQNEPVYEAAVVPTTEETAATVNTYDDVSSEPVPVFTPEPEPEVEPEQVEEKKEEPAPAAAPLDANSLAAMIREVVREIVKDEIARQPKDERPENDNHSVVGATFGGPLVVQYFNGGINGVTPAAPVVAPAPVEEKKEEPAPVEEKKEEEPVVVEEVKEEPEPIVEAEAEEKPVEAPAEAEEVVEEPEEVQEAPVEEAPEAEVVEEAPEVVEEAVVEEEPVEAPAEAEEVVVEEEVPVVAEIAKAPIIRIPFEERMIHAEKEMQDNYNEIKNEIMSYGVHSRVSSSGDTFRLHRKTYVKLTIAGKSLKLYFALDPADYADSKMPIGDASNKAIYAEIPFVFKVKSGLSMRRCKGLIADVMAKDGLEQGTVDSVNWVKEIKAELKEREKSGKAKEADDEPADDEEE